MLLADAEGRPIAFAPTPGNVADISMAIPILEGIARPKRRGVCGRLSAAPAWEARDGRML